MPLLLRFRIRWRLRPWVVNLRLRSSLSKYRRIREPTAVERQSLRMFLRILLFRMAWIWLLIQALSIQNLFYLRTISGLPWVIREHVLFMSTRSMMDLTTPVLFFSLRIQRFSPKTMWQERRPSILKSNLRMVVLLMWSSMSLLVERRLFRVTLHLQECCNLTVISIMKQQVKLHKTGDLIRTMIFLPITLSMRLAQIQIHNAALKSSSSIKPMVERGLIPCYNLNLAFCWNWILRHRLSRSLESWEFSRQDMRGSTFHLITLSADLRVSQAIQWSLKQVPILLIFKAWHFQCPLRYGTPM